MGIYLPKRKGGRQKSPFYHYDFQLKPKGTKKSQRFHGSTGQRTKKAAERVEAKIRELAALGQLNLATTVDDACTRYWEEHLIRARGADDQATILEHLCEFYGRETPIVAITPDEVAKAAAMRARTPIKRYNSRSKTIEPTSILPTPSSVNRQVVEPMRRLLRRAKKTWKMPIDLEQFDWAALKYEEPAERIRELSIEEELRFWDALRPDYHPICEMYIISGRRRSDWVMLPKFRVDRTAGTVRFPSRKRAQVGEIMVELNERELEIILSEWDRAPSCEYVFTYEIQRGADKGKRMPITASGFRRVTDIAFKKAKLKDFRRHDFRHTFGSRALRGKGNLKKLMVAMDHQDLKSTLRYAHVEQQEMPEYRSGVTVSRNSPGTNVVPIKSRRNK